MGAPKVSTDLSYEKRIYLETMHYSLPVNEQAKNIVREVLGLGKGLSRETPAFLGMA